MKYTANNKPLVCMMTQSTCYKGTSKMTPKGVLWHSTGANNPSLKRYVQPDDNAPDKEEMLKLIGKNQYNNDWNHIDRQAGLNAWIGKLADGTITSIQTMPWDFKPWGCGSGAKGSCNNGWMQFEICEDNLNDKAYFNAVYQEACELTAYYCKMYNLDPYGTVSYNGVQVPVILDHKTSYELGLGGNHGDVRHWFKKYGKTLDDVRKDVAALMGVKEPVKEDGKIDGVYIKGEKVKLAPNFVSTEFDCHGKGCCTETEVDQKLVKYLQKIHDHFNKATHISSGYRCPVHNKNAGGATGSRHAKGQAADIYINGVKPAEIAKYAESIGIKGIGLYETDKDGHFVHIDTRTTKAFWYGQAQAPRTTFGGLEPEPPKQETSNKSEKNEVEFKPGDLVKLAADAVYYSDKKIPSWVKQKNWFVKSVSGDRVVIDESEDGKSHINSPINAKHLVLINSFTKKEEKEENESNKYSVKVTASILNYRQGPGTSYKIKGTLKKGEIYSIVEEKNGWGKLSEDKGWISLKYTEKIEGLTEEYRLYTVKAGDNLWNIAADLLNSGPRYTEIKSLNELTSNTIHKGMVLKIPNN